MKFTLASVPPSGNQLERLARSPRARWALKKKMRARLAWEIRFALLDAGLPIPFPVRANREVLELLDDGSVAYRRPEKMRVVVRVFRDRLLDPDNAAAGLKVHLDAMRDIGLLWNDSPKWLSLEVEQFIDKENPRTEIEIEPFTKSSEGG